MRIPTLPGKQISELLSMVVLKMASLMLMGYVMLFLTVFGGLQDVGSYSAVTAMTAPVAMFLMFRYVEWIALAGNKVAAFSVSVLVAVGGFIVAAPLIYAVLSGVTENGVFLVFLIAWKPLEIFGDFFISYLISCGDKRGAIRSVVCKLLGVVALSMLGVLAGFDNFPLLISWALFLGFVFVVVFHDLRIVRRKKSFVMPGWRGIVDYVRSNFKFGLLGVLVSVNSLVPRYYLMAAGDIAMLGLFSLLYLVAASAVNLLQYPISLKAAEIKNFFCDRIYLFDYVPAMLGAVLILMTIVGMFFSVNVRDGVSGLMGVLVVLFFSALMFLYLLFRGLSLSLAIAANRADFVYVFVVFSALSGFLFSLIVWFFNSEISDIFLSSYFVIVSSFVAGALLLRRVRAGVGLAS